MDPVVAGAFLSYMVPGIGAAFVDGRARALGPDGLVRETLRLCAAEPDRVDPEIVRGLVGMARERREMPWATGAYLQAARSIEAVARLRPDWQFTVLEHCGHIPQIEDPSGFIDLVEAWLASRPELAAAS
jgi:pimeloyl-ACP methyl ester carboxylesterase